jgi:hypothetical protein
MQRKSTSNQEASRSALRTAVCICGQTRSFGFSFLQWQDGFLDTLRAGTDLDFFLIASDSASLEIWHDLLESMQFKAKVVVDSFTFLNKSSVQTWAVKEERTKLKDHIKVSFNMNRFPRPPVPANMTDISAESKEKKAFQWRLGYDGEEQREADVDSFWAADSYILQNWQTQKCVEMAKAEELKHSFNYTRVARLRSDIAYWASGLDSKATECIVKNSHDVCKIADIAETTKTAIASNALLLKNLIGKEWGINMADFGVWGSRGFMFDFLGKGLKNLHADRYIRAWNWGNAIEELYTISGADRPSNMKPWHSALIRMGTCKHKGECSMGVASQINKPPYIVPESTQWDMVEQDIGCTKTDEHCSKAPWQKRLQRWALPRLRDIQRCIGVSVCELGSLKMGLDSAVAGTPDHVGDYDTLLAKGGRFMREEDLVPCDTLPGRAAWPKQHSDQGH